MPVFEPAFSSRRDFHGAPGEARTPDLLIRSQPLYPAELRARFACSCLSLYGSENNGARAH